MNVLITGAQGLVGRYLTAAWLRADRAVRVVGIGRSPGQNEFFTHRIHWHGRSLPVRLPAELSDELSAATADSRYRYQVLDLRDAVAVSRVLDAQAIDCVIHLATALRDEPFDTLMASNLAATHGLLEGIVRSTRRKLRIVVGSSGSVYGAVPPGRLPVQEDQDAQPVDLYAVSKRAAEDVAAVYARSHELQVVVARIFNVVGAGQEERHLCGFLARQFAERTTARDSRPIAVGPLTATRDFVDVRDVASALIMLGTAPQVQARYNVASGVESPSQAVFDLLAEATGQRGIPMAALPPRRLEMPRHYADIGRLRALGYAPRYSLRDSLLATLGPYLALAREPA
jgi:nucleoside-diphosphate-sugar epimerase